MKPHESRWSRDFLFSQASSFQLLNLVGKYAAMIIFHFHCIAGLLILTSTSMSCAQQHSCIWTPSGQTLSIAGNRFDIYLHGKLHRRQRHPENKTDFSSWRAIVMNGKAWCQA